VVGAIVGNGDLGAVVVGIWKLGRRTSVVVVASAARTRALRPPAAPGAATIVTSTPTPASSTATCLRTDARVAVARAGNRSGPPRLGV
jgi:hypothetical protein